MHIEGLKAVVRHKRRHSVLTHFHPVTGGPRLLSLEMLSSGKALLELHEGGELPGEGPGEQIFLEHAEDPHLVERMIRAMAVYHFGLDEAGAGHTIIDTELMSRGFELGFSEGRVPCWIRLASAMNVVIRNETEDGLPSNRQGRVSMLCIIPGRNQIRFMCENLATAFKALEKNRPFKIAQVGDEADMLTMDIVDSETVVYH